MNILNIFLNIFAYLVNRKSKRFFDLISGFGVFFVISFNLEPLPPTYKYKAKINIILHFLDFIYIHILLKTEMGFQD